MQTLATGPTPQASPSTAQRFKWYARLSIIAIALVVVPTVVLQGPALVLKGSSNPYGGAAAFVYLPLSFAIWQAALVFLYLAGAGAVSKQPRTVATLLTSYVLTASGAIALFWLFPARFY